ncbi:MAG: metallophosphoesterase [Bacteroidia bacterium]|nr:metallophosphoesterase [Bacteroidia bacterium]
MKIYHLADIHLASKMEQFEEKAEVRRQEVFTTLQGVVKRAHSEGVGVILFSGDVFDKPRPTMKDKKQFYNLVKDYPNIQFLYLRGNHDYVQSYHEDIPNLLTFTDSEWTKYEFGGVVVAGRELTKENVESLHEGLLLDEDNYNIVMLHGSVPTMSNSKDLIQIDKFKNKNINYLALGHIHKRAEGEIDKRGVWVYSGNLEGRGYDEVGEKGFIEIDTDKQTHTFIPCCSREVVVKQVDLSAAADDQEALRMVDGVLEGIDERNIVKLELKGKVKFDMEGFDERVKRRVKRFFHLKVKDMTKRYVSIDEYEKKNSLVGEFIRQVRDDETLSDDEKQEIYELGIEVLIG